MSRAATGDVVAIQAENNVYTVLAIATVLVQIIGLILIYIRANAIGVSFF
ncbi:MAG: hypothetical protein H7Z14_02650 [Anaerolineae bacterium]|nr:hypothetical protein [Phycisphaerae bacterium]